ncbi:variant erythrocyte surface antigen-1 family protein [Babesia caballi]|uniref:Variant erythrocyte surface antigen-1 family protein n=1 Tax=Babesia caballi TaxID=5871 RepID=A0AAV4LYN9_BABCB|nr:variant erythrocyte surface antigen-1 family protein [Babesia caballi]
MASPGKKLTDCPSNLKEAIDWILRVTGKDGQVTGGTRQLAGAITRLLDGVQSSSPELEPRLNEIKEALSPGGTDGIIGALANGLEGFKNAITSNRENVYQVLNSGLAPEVPKAGEIFLGCVPLCFYGLSYLYWRCSENGGWKTLKLNDRDGSALKNFMASQGFDTNQLKGGSNGGQIVAEALKSFNSFHSTINKNTSFTHFLKNLRSAASTTTHPLSSLFLGATFYFESKRPKTHKSPSTIRQMLFWLCALTTSPHFIDLLDQFNTAVPDGFKVAVSGRAGGHGLQTLSPDDLAVNLVTSSLLSSHILVTIQGLGDPENPLLHEIYGISEFSYPSSGTALFRALCDYSYALQFQLLFLFQQCSRSTIHGCAWQDCRYGSGVQAHSDSHICPTKCNSSHATNSNHNSNCNHVCNGQSPLQAFLTDNLKGFHVPQEPDPLSSHHLENHLPGSMCHVKMGFTPERIKVVDKRGFDIQTVLRPLCGSDTSPLRQLCEKLSCLRKRTPRSLGDMFGFYLQLIDQLFRSRLNIGSLVTNMFLSLQSSLPSLTQNNDIYAAVGYIDAAVAKRLSQSPPQPPSGQALSLLSIYNELPFWFQLFSVDGSKDLPVTLFDLRQHCHKEGTSFEIKHNDTGCSKVNDLWSLYYNVSDPNNRHKACASGTCGGYLYPLCYANGAMFAPKHATSYLSWVLYLTDDLYTGFDELKAQFEKLQCGDCGTTCKDRGECHTGSVQCTCPSIVKCSGVLGLLYSSGFNFNTTTLLNGWQKPTRRGASWTSNPTLKRTCRKLHTRLSNVLAENAPLHNLLLAIDEFMYYVRFRFMSMVSSFWLCSLAILFYFSFYGIDVLHFKSHAHVPSSHTVPPIGLLTTGKVPALTKLTYYLP